MKQNGFFVEVIKTDIVDVNDSSHPLPPHNGSYEEFKVADYYCPEEWSNDGVFIPVKEGDPMWFDFRCIDECAILCAVQRINPVTGEPANLEEGLDKNPAQNYLRMPEQQWLDGYAKEGKVYQFVVTKAGIGLAVNEYILPKHMQDSHAIGFAFFGPKNPKPKPAYRTIGATYPYKSIMPIGGYQSGTWISDAHFCGGGGSASGSSRGYTMGLDSFHSIDEPTSILCSAGLDTDTVNQVDSCEMGASIEEVETVDVLAAQEAKLNELDKASMGAGGRIIQKIITDENTVDYYHEKRSALLTIYFALPKMYDAIMKKGKRQDASKQDKYRTSGHIGGVAVPLVIQESNQ